jgi:tRNA threonylcarbamoyladenosine biosynthesis protein TsaB
MKMLAIETATLTASVAIVTDDATLAVRERAVDTHSDVLLVLIDAALKDAGMVIADVDGVAVGAGPGSFTGLRIGMATAKGLCFANDVPLWTVSSLAALALDAGPHPGRAVVPVLDAKKSEVFAAAFRVDGGAPEPLTEERVMSPARLGSLLEGLPKPVLLGTGVAAYEQIISDLDAEVLTGARNTPSAESVGKLALRASEHSNLAAAAPTYVRLSEAELKWKKHIP